MIQVAGAQRFEAQVFVYLPDSIQDKAVVDIFLELVQIIYEGVSSFC